MVLPALLVSPHLDDAVLGAGQLLAGRPDAWVATVFTGEPDPPRSTTFDLNGGWFDSSEAMAGRRLEDRAALGLLGVERVIHLGYLDNAYRAEGDQPAHDLAAVLADLLDQLYAAGGSVVLAPMGLAHPDHELVTDAVIAAVRAHPYRPELVLWEDTPTRVLEPQLVEHRRGELLARRVELRWASPGTGPLERKEQAVREYRSQLWALDLHAVLCPERFWRVHP